MADAFEEAEMHLCVICLGEDTRPVAPKCGHRICMACLSNETPPSSCCTECQGFYQLETQADMAMHAAEEGMCEKHREQKVYCENSKTLLCVACSKSEHPENHTHWPIATAAQYYREEIQLCLQNFYRMGGEVQELLLIEKEEPLIWTVIWVDKTNRRMFQKQLKPLWEEKMKEEKVVVGKENKELYELYQTLKEKEAKQEVQIMEDKKEWETMVSSVSRFLIDIIIELEEKMQKSDVDMLQDVAETLERSLFWPDLEPFILSLDDSYVSAVVEFLKVFQRHKLSERSKFYNLSEEKKRIIRKVSDFSSEKCLAYTYGSLQAEEFGAMEFIIEA